MQKNEIVELEITSVSNLGYGVGRYNGVVVFVPGAVFGDRVKAKIIKVTKKYCVARLEEMLCESSERETAPFCPAPASCGGCVYRFLKYQREREIKRDSVEAEFRKAGLADVTVLPTLCVENKNGVPKTRAYRNKAQYCFCQTKNGIRAGFFASGTHRVAGYENCSLHPEIFKDIAVWLCRRADKEKLTVYNEETGKGLLRHLYLRRGEATKEILVAIVINGQSFPNEKSIADDLCRAFPSICGVLINVNCQNTNLITGKDYRIICGKGTLNDIFCGLKLEISPAAFYQVNHDAAELLCKTAGKLIDTSAGKLRLLDLYCGIGTIGLSLAEYVSELCGVEIVPEAVECAKKNAVENGIEKAKFICADSADGAAEMLEAAGYTPDIVVLDPPRKGCSEELLTALSSSKISQIIYISCNPATLARDCAFLKAHGFSIGNVTPVDLFPRTGHVECVVKLTRASL